MKSRLSKETAKDVNLAAASGFAARLDTDTMTPTQAAESIAAFAATRMVQGAQSQ